MHNCVGAIIIQQESVLLGMRSATRAFYPNVWDVFGGHVELGESHRQTLERELVEELGIVPTGARFLETFRVPSSIEGDQIECHLYLVTEWSGTPSNRQLHEHWEIRWFRFGEARCLELAAPEYGRIMRMFGDMKGESVLEAKRELNPPYRRSLDIIAAIGLGFGAVFGLAGTMVSQAPLRQMFWAIDGIGLVVASALLTVKFLRKGNDCVAAGFLVFAIGESLLVSGTAAGLAGSVPSFGGGVALWAVALLLTSIPGEFATWVRLVGVVASVLFAVVAARIFWGEQLLPTSTPLPFFAYPFLVITLLGWIWFLVKGERVATSGIGARQGSR